MSTTGLSAMLHRPPPAQARPAARPLQVEITGELLNDAQMRIEPATGRATLTLHLDQGDNHPPVLAVLRYGDDHDAAFVAQQRAEAMPTGQRVRVVGEGLLTRWDRGTLVFAIVRVADVQVLEAAP